MYVGDVNSLTVNPELDKFAAKALVPPTHTELGAAVGVKSSGFNTPTWNIGIFMVLEHPRGVKGAN